MTRRGSPGMRRATFGTLSTALIGCGWAIARGHPATPTGTDPFDGPHPGPGRLAHYPSRIGQERVDATSHTTRNPIVATCTVALKTGFRACPSPVFWRYPHSCIPSGSLLEGKRSTRQWRFRATQLFVCPYEVGAETSPQPSSRKCFPGSGRPSFRARLGRVVAVQFAWSSGLQLCERALIVLRSSAGGIRKIDPVSFSLAGRRFRTLFPHFRNNPRCHLLPRNRAPFSRH